MKILAFSGSNSSKSINQDLIDFVYKQFNKIDIELIKLTNYDIPIFSEDE